jgi:hypothetical protein
MWRNKDRDEPKRPDRPPTSWATLNAHHRKTSGNHAGNGTDADSAEGRELVAMLRRYDDARLPDPTFLDHLEHTLLAAAQRMPRQAQTTPTIAPVSDHVRVVTEERRTRSLIAPLAARSHRRALSHVAMAFLLLVTGLSLYVAFRPLDHQATSPGEETPTVPVITPIPSIPGIDIEAFGSMTLPVDTSRPIVAIGDPTEAWGVEMTTTTLAPGATGQHPTIDYAKGTGVELVLDGTLKISSDATLRVTHLDGTTSDIPPGEPVTVNRGESVEHDDITVAQTWSNPGPGQTVLLGIGVFGINEIESDFEGYYVHFGGLDWSRATVDLRAQWSAFGLADGPVTATIRRLTIAPGAALPPARDSAPTLRWVESGEIGWTPVGDGIATRASNKPLNRYFSGQRVPWTTNLTTEAILSNPSKKESAVVWEIVLTPRTPSLATPTDP